VERGELEVKKQVKAKPNQTVVLKSPVYIIGSYSVAGKKEGAGPLGKTFSKVVDDEYFGCKTHEQAEQKMFEYAIRGAIKQSKVEPEMLMAGDLLNQIISSSFAARSFDMPFIGLYGACSTMALSLSMGSLMISSGFRKSVVVAAGSHWATAERQYRTPMELGNTRPPVSQWTVTGVGSCVLSGNPAPKSPKITAVTFGKVCDWGTIDVNNMGAAMAPAAAETVVAHFKDTKTTVKDFDAIYTGDLGKMGSQIFRDLVANENYKVDGRYKDCGCLIYDNQQTQYQGGSGCGCSAVTLNGHIMKKLKSGEYKKILFVATGALLSPVSSFQGNSIPSIAHAVVVEG